MTSVTDTIQKASLLLGQLGQSGADLTSIESAVLGFRDLCREATPSAMHVIVERASTANAFDASAAQAAARMLAEIGGARATQALLELTLSTDLTQSLRGWFALGNLRRSPEHYELVAARAVNASAGVASAQNLLADALGRQLSADKYGEAMAWAQRHPVSYVRQAMFKALARRGGPEAELFLREALTDDDPVIAGWAAFGLLMEGHHEGAPRAPIDVLLALQRSKSKEARLEAVTLLGLLPHPESVAPVLDSTSDRVAAVRLAAIVGCGNLGVRESLPALTPLLAHSSPATAEQAAAILRDLLGEDPGYQWQGRALTAASIAEVQGLCQRLSQTWIPGKRYLHGELGSSAGYARAVVEGTPSSAFWSLAGMAGQRFDYDPTADVIANWEPLSRLRAWAALEGASLSPGGFYLHGQVLSPAPLA